MPKPCQEVAGLAEGTASMILADGWAPSSGVIEDTQGSRGRLDFVAATICRGVSERPARG